MKITSTIMTSSLERAGDFIGNAAPHTRSAGWISGYHRPRGRLPVMPPRRSSRALRRFAGLSVPHVASPQALQLLGLFEARCAVCHPRPADDRTPTRNPLRARTPEPILDAITTGSMAV